MWLDKPQAGTPSKKPIEIKLFVWVVYMYVSFNSEFEFWLISAPLSRKISGSQSSCEKETVVNYQNTDPREDGTPILEWLEGTLRFLPKAVH